MSKDIPVKTVIKVQDIKVQNIQLVEMLQCKILVIKNIPSWDVQATGAQFSPRTSVFVQSKATSSLHCFHSSACKKVGG